MLTDAMEIQRGRDGKIETNNYIALLEVGCRIFNGAMGISEANVEIN